MPTGPHRMPHSDEQNTELLDEGPVPKRGRRFKAIRKDAVTSFTQLSYPCIGPQNYQHARKYTPLLNIRQGNIPEGYVIK